MPDFFNQADTTLFLFFNGLHHPFTDQVFFLISNKFIWIPFYALLAYFLFKKEKKSFVLLLLMIAVTIALSDQIASSIIKPLVMRLRPCHEPGLNVHIVNDYCGGMYGFVSSHAANTFALVTFLSHFFNSKAERWILFSWAILISMSRVFLGVHYPGDIIGGAIVGILSAIVCLKVYNFIQTKR